MNLIEKAENFDKKIVINKLTSIILFGIQLFLTFVTTSCIYMFYAFIDSNKGFDEIVGLIIFHSIFAILFSSITIFICLIVGLPLRFIKRLNYWWISNFYISIIGIFIGVIFILMSLIPAFSDTVNEILS